MLARVEQDVGGLDVPMDETFRVCRIESVRDLAADGERAGRVERALGAQQRTQIRTLDEAHRQVEATVDVACVVDRHDVRVLERHGELRLAGEAVVEALIEGQLRRDELQRDGPLQPQVVGPVDDAHAALADQLLDSIAEKVGSDLDLGGRAHWWDLVDNRRTALAGIHASSRSSGESRPALRHR